MEKLNILLACGSGASSGFMASNMRKAAKKRGLEANITAVSDGEIEEHLGEIDALLIGPHIQYLEAELQKSADPYNVPVATISQAAYGILDGEKALDEALALLKK